VNRENRELTMVEIKKELDQLVRTPIGSEELETARNHFIGSLQSEVTTAFAHADKFKTILLNALPADYYQRMITTVSNLQADNVQRCADTYFNTEGFTELSVG
jgi:zinc protease